ncbi:hypothetical protein A6A19_00785 [Actinobacillus delphinicola]|uniref:hypothetical protein n=1 Tax=Actinobacillus delphinicola TaxID=51161 RepID=UPI002441B031|nr:hypothetical protein [Actinobacillus delphinicola]MDG6896565.1 hypothetical protein [Actinobacillus delphinicola]
MNPFDEIIKSFKKNLSFNELDEETRRCLFWKFYDENGEPRQKSSFKLEEFSGKAAAMNFIGFLITQWRYNEKCRNFIKNKNKDFIPDKEYLLKEWEQTRIKPNYQVMNYGNRTRTTRLF